MSIDTAEGVLSLAKYSLFLLIVMLLAVSDTATAEMRTIISERVIIHYPPQLEAAAQTTERIYPTIVSELEETLRLPVEFRPSILFQNNRREFINQTGNELVLAVAVPGQNLIVIDYTRMTGDPFIFRTTLKHEVAHLLLHHHIDRTLLPRWFDEGIAQWISDGISELITEAGWSVLENAVIRGNLYRLEDITESFPAGRTETALAYQQSKHFVEYLIHIYGANAIVDILHRMRNGESIERAFAAVLPHTLREIEYRWTEDLREQTSWVYYISRHMFQLIFLLAAVLVIIVFIKSLIQRRRIEDEPYDDTGMV
jgi:hypothetical protein